MIVVSLNNYMVNTMYGIYFSVLSFFSYSIFTHFVMELFLLFYYYVGMLGHIRAFF